MKALNFLSNIRPGELFKKFLEHLLGKYNDRKIRTAYQDLFYGELLLHKHKQMPDTFSLLSTFWRKLVAYW